jgi:isoprenylcysteine carboxyl methyltransferase (ICMT) family protein YpbQ
MNIDDLLVRRAVVLGSALVYWAGVWAQARRIRKRIGRSPSVKPRSPKERWLWLGWILVVAAWIALPLLARLEHSSAWVRVAPELTGNGSLYSGLFLVVAGYAGTLWCYHVMGERWRMGLDRRHKGALVTEGPYRVVRHPIYLFQMVMLAGVLVLLPTLVSVLMLAVHYICALIKARDEESHLHEVHGAAYAGYLGRTGMFLPPLRKRHRTVPSS